MGIVMAAVGILDEALSKRPDSLSVTLVRSALDAAGAGMVGAALKSLLYEREEFGVYEDVRRTLEAIGLPALMTTGHANLETLSAIRRQDWHHYYVTETDEGPTWWHHLLPMSTATEGPQFTFASQVVEVTGGTLRKEHTYRVEGFVKEGRLFLFHYRSHSTEGRTVEIFPAVDGTESVFWGLTTLESWRKTQLLSRAVLSREPLTAGEKLGPLSADDARLLDLTWERLALEPRHHRIFFGDTEPAVLRVTVASGGVAT